MPTSRSPISRGRAQDWITSVLNPIIDGLRREKRILASGTWSWIWTRQDFEYLHPISQYVSALFSDNLDDFLAKNSKWKREFEAHDRALGELGHAVRGIYDVVLQDEALRDELHPFAKAHRHGREYFASYVASGFKELPSDYGLSESYNEAAGLRSKALKIAESHLQEARTAASRLVKRVDQMLPQLVVTRTRIADRFGAQIRPVDQSIGWVREDDSP